MGSGAIPGNTAIPTSIPRPMPMRRWASRPTVGEVAARRLAWCLACAMVAYGEDDAPSPVSVGGFSVVPEKDRFIAADGRFVLHPMAFAGLSYDDNVPASSPAQSDFYAHLAPRPSA